MAKLTFILDDGQEIQVPLGERVTIGRRDGHDVVIDDLRISSDHAEVRRSGADFLVRDLGSKGGTFLNDVRIEEHRLRDGDRLRFGPLRAVFDAEPSPSPEAEGPAPTRKTRAKAAKKTSKKTTSNPSPAAKAVAPTRAKKSASRAATTAPAVTPEVPATEPETPGPSGVDLTDELRQLTCQRDEILAALKADEDRLQGVTQELATVEARLREVSQELQLKTARVAQLLADEERLGHLQSALEVVEAKHAERSAAITALTADHDRCSAELGQLQTASAKATQDAEVASQQKREAQDQLKRLSDEHEAVTKGRDEAAARLAELRQAITEAEQRAAELNGHIQSRGEALREIEARVVGLEKSRSGLMTEIAGHESTLAKLQAAAAELESTRAAKTQIESDISTLSARYDEHQSRLGSIVQSISDHSRIHADAEEGVARMRERLAAEEKTLLAHQAAAQATRSQLETERVAADAALRALLDEHETETMRLDETHRKREEIERQIHELAAVEGKLHQTRIALQKVEGQRTETEALVMVLEEKKAFLHTTIDSLSADEGTTRGKLEVLRSREKDLRHSLEELSQREQSERKRFEEIRRLSTEAEKEHEAQTERFQSSIDLTRRELGDLELKLVPLREWKDAMDRRYEKLAALPEDSAEARALWGEIEGEKANLRKLITAGAGRTGDTALSDAVLLGLADSGVKRDSPSSAASSKHGHLHAPISYQEGDSPEERANVGTTGTGAMLSGTGQEMALRARLSKLRESVQREATRLEFLRQERTRDEARARSASTGGEQLMREHDRQLEIKIRREEEKLATLMRKLEMASMEEERRRDKITDMERKLAELRTDITEAERERSGARHKMEIAHAELKSLEDAAERLKKMGEN